MKDKFIEMDKNYKKYRIITQLNLWLLFAFAVFTVLDIRLNILPEKAIVPVYLIMIILIIGLPFAFFLTETLICKKMTKKVVEYMQSEKYADGIEYLQKIPQINIFCTMLNLYSYFSGVLSLYLDDKKNAEQFFKSVDLVGTDSKIDVQLFCLFYLYLIYEDEERAEELDQIKKCYLNKRENYFSFIKTHAKRYDVQKTLQVFDAFINKNDLVIEEFLSNKKDIPIVKRTAERERKRNGVLESGKKAESKEQKTPEKKGAADKTEKTDKADKTEKTDKADKTEKTNKTDKDGKTKTPEKKGAADKTEKTDKADKKETTKKTEKKETTKTAEKLKKGEPLKSKGDANNGKAPKKRTEKK